MSATSSDGHLSVFDDISKETMITIVTVIIVGFVGAISIFGIASNVINILVFCKQGFSETSNISFTALAISDLLSLVATLSLSIFWNPVFLNSGLPLAFADLWKTFTSLPYACFSRITGLVTAFATFERCLCVVWPLKFKGILTPTVTKFYMVSIYLMICLTMVPTYSTLTLGWRSEPMTNKTLLGVTNDENSELISNISHILHSAIQFIAFFAVIFFTVTLIVCLRQKTAWRTQQTKAQNAAKMATKRQDKVIRIVILISTIYVVTFLPTTISLAVTVACPNVGPMGRYKNRFFIFWSFTMLFGTLNASVNSLVYYVMSSNFRQTCDQIISRLLLSSITKYKA